MKTNQKTYYKCGYMKTTLTKTSKTKLKSTVTLNMFGSKKTEKISEKTRLSAKRFYFKHIKPIYK